MLNEFTYMIVQLLLGLLLIGVMVYFSIRQARMQKKIMKYIQILETLAQNHDSIAHQFERNLKEKESIISELVKLLDERIDKARELADYIQGLRDGIDASKGELSMPANPEHDKVLRLARRGLDARQIAHHLQKPIGEIELILSLYGIPPLDNQA